MKLKGLYRGFEILKLDEEKAVCAEHDQIWVDSDEIELSKKELAEINTMGWLIDDGTWSHFA